MWYNEGNQITCDRRGAGNTRRSEHNLIGGYAMDSISSCPHYVYELIDPRDNSIFYVGLTAGLLKRYKQHMRRDGSNSQKDQRIQEILASGHLPIMRTKEQCPSLEYAAERESYWIQEYLRQGIVLLNLAVPIPLRKFASTFGR